MQQLTGWVDFPRSAVEFEERFGSEDACYAYLAQQGCKARSCADVESGTPALERA